MSGFSPCSRLECRFRSSAVPVRLEVSGLHPCLAERRVSWQDFLAMVWPTATIEDATARHVQVLTSSPMRRWPKDRAKMLRWAELREALAVVRFIQVCAWGWYAAIVAAGCNSTHMSLPSPQSSSSDANRCPCCSCSQLGVSSPVMQSHSNALNIVAVPSMNLEIVKEDENDDGTSRSWPCASNHKPMWD